MSIYSSRKKQRKLGANHLGHLKLSVEEDSGALVVTVYEARGLKRKEGSSNDVYVKLYMLPDPGKHTKEKTKRSKDKDPVYNEKFNFFLNDKDDYNKTLFVSIWNRERAGRTEMMGCMSFNVSELVNSNGVKGWYQLLPEERGKKESAAVPSIMSKAGSTLSLASTVSAPPSSCSKKFAVTLVCSPSGYGFKLRDETPVYISEVTEGLPAHQLDLRVGDMIVEVNGTDVTRANGRMVAEMIKKHRDALQMIMQRDVVNFSPNSIGPVLTSQSHASYSLTDLSTSDTLGITRTRRTHLPAFSSSQQSSHFVDSKTNYPGLLTQPADLNDYQLEDPSSFMNNQYKVEKTTPSRERLPEVPEEHMSNSFTSEKAQQQSNGLPRSNSQASQKSGGTHGFHDFHRPSLGNLSFSQPGGLDSVSNRGGYRHDIRKRSLGSTMEDNKGLYDLALNSAMRSKSRGSSGSMLNQPYSFQRPKFSVGSSVGSTEDSAYSTANSMRSLNHYPSDDHSLSPSIFDLQNRGRSPPMNTAIQKVSPTTPLDNDQSRTMSSSLEDFQPVVEWESLNKLEQKRQRCLNSLMKCEREFFTELKKGIDNFSTPLSGVISENSHRTIFMSLDRMYELSNYFYSQICQHTLQINKAPTNVACFVEEFAAIYHSKLHLLVKSFEAYLRNTESARKEIAVCSINEGFQKIVVAPPALYTFVESGSEYLPKMCRLLTVISYATPLDHPDQQYLTKIIDTVIDLLPIGCSDLEKNWKSEKEIMQNLKKAITFPSSSNVKSFDIIKPGRVLLHDGEALIYTEKRKKKKVRLLLFSDMLLVTKRNRDVLYVLETPFPLNSVIVQDLNCEKDEFQISTDDGVSMRQFKFTSQQDRDSWIQKIKERAMGSYKRNTSKPKQPSEVSKKQEALKSELELELRTPYQQQPSRQSNYEQDSDLFSGVRIDLEKEHQFTTDSIPNGASTQISPGSSPYNAKRFIPPSTSSVFPALSQPILPSKFATISTKKPTEVQKPSANTRKISGIFKRRSVEISSLSQSNFGFSSPLFPKR